MSISIISIIIAAVALFLSIVSPLFNALYRTPRHKDNNEQEDDENSTNDNNNKDTAVSIVIVAHDNAPELERSLPLFLSQEYKADYQVIIVADKSDSETDDIIKRFSHHNNLYATFMPLSSRYISRKKLAITLGIKAAKHPWVIVTDAWCRPKDSQWLRSFASYFSENNDIVLGYTTFDKAAPARYSYEHTLHAAYHLWFATRAKAISTNCHLVAIRKQLFLDEDGFLGNLKYARGEYAFLVNKYSTEENTTVALSKTAFLEEETPFKKRWTNNHLFDINSHKSLVGFARHKALYYLDNSWLLLSLFCNILAISYGLLLHDWIVLSIAILSFLLNYLLRALLSRQTLSAFECRVSCLIIPLLDYSQPFCDLIWRIRYRFADKYDFITHKI